MRLLIALLGLATLPAWAVVSFTLDAIPPGPSIVGQRVTLVSYVSGVSSPRYRFEVRNAGGDLTYARDWTTGRSTWWTPDAPGTYGVTALVRSGSGGTPIERTLPYTVNAKLSDVAIAIDGAKTVAPGTAITFTATPTGGGTVEFRPLIGLRVSPSSATVWDQTRPWGADRSWTFTPQTPGYYYLRVYAREVGSLRYFDVSSPDLVLTVNYPRVTGFTVTLAPAGGGVVGAPTTLTISDITGGGPGLEWKCLVKLSVAPLTASSWTTVRDFTASPTITWTPAAAELYDIAIKVHRTGVGTPTYDLAKVVKAYRVMPAQRVNPTDGSVLLYVAPGPFLMGTPSDATYSHNPNQCPQRTVYLDGYWIMRDEVTVAQYRAFCSATGHPMPAFPSGGSWPASGWDDPDAQQWPMVYVTWEDAHAYATCAGLVLPTEAQWEKAARGTDGRLYTWGNTWNAAYCANYWNAYSHPQPVGSHPMDTSPCGCRDMAGNVAEWCADWFSNYDPLATANPVGPASGTQRVARGGGYGSQGDDMYRTTKRSGSSPTGLGFSLGFRCASPVQ